MSICTCNFHEPEINCVHDNIYALFINIFRLAGQLLGGSVALVEVADRKNNFRFKYNFMFTETADGKPRFRTVHYFLSPNYKIQLNHKPRVSTISSLHILALL